MLCLALAALYTRKILLSWPEAETNADTRSHHETFCWEIHGHVEEMAARETCIATCEVCKYLIYLRFNNMDCCGLTKPILTRKTIRSGLYFQVWGPNVVILCVVIWHWYWPCLFIWCSILQILLVTRSWCCQFPLSMSLTVDHMLETSLPCRYAL